MEFSRPEYWNGYPFPSPGDLPNPGIKPRSPALQAASLPAEPQGKPVIVLWRRWLIQIEMRERFCVREFTASREQILAFLKAIWGMLSLKTPDPSPGDSQRPLLTASSQYSSDILTASEVSKIQIFYKISLSQSVLGMMFPGILIVKTDKYLSPLCEKKEKRRERQIQVKMTGSLRMLIL